MTPAPVITEPPMTPLALTVLDAAVLQPGHRVLDVGCGDGDITLEAARRIGARGLALGIDESAAMVERARRRASEAGLANVGFVRADARTHSFAPLRFDVVVSRRALASCVPNLARALWPGGRFVFVSPDEPAGLRAELARAGLDQTVLTRVEVDGTRSWVVAAGAPG